MQLVLASSSPYRKKQLATLGLSFICANPDIDESAKIDETPDKLALRLAVQKAQAVSSLHPTAIIIGSDQVACFEDKLIGKPGNKNAAVEQLRALSGKKVFFYSAIALLNTNNNTLQQHITETVVCYRTLSEQQISYYLECDEPFDCAGSFKCESLGIAILESVTSNDPSALIGLPLIALTEMLFRAGLSPLENNAC
jgi:septum formation protein